MGKKKVTLSLEEKEYSKFQKYCVDNAMNFSKKIELLIKEFLKNKKFAVFLWGFLAVLFLANAASFVDDSQSDFDLGNYNNTFWNGSAVVLSSGNLSGNYFSKIFDAGQIVLWNSLNWTTTPYETHLTLLMSPTHAEDEFGGDVTALVRSLSGTPPADHTWERVEVQSWDAGLNASDVIDSVLGYCHIFYSDSNAYVGFQVSTDSGTTWSAEQCKQIIVPEISSYRCDLTNTFGIDSVDELNNIYLRCTFPNSTQNDFYSTDWVNLFVRYNSSIYWNNSGHDLIRNSFLFGVDALGDIFNSNDTGFLWRQTADNYGRTTDTQDIFSYGNFIYIISLSNREVWRSTNFGTSFSVVNNSFANSNLLLGETNSQGNLFVVDASGDVYQSSDNGISWTLKGDFNGGATNNGLGIAINSTDAIFIVDGSGSVYMSIDKGVSWTEQNSGYGGTSGTDGMAVDSSGNLYILLNKIIYKSTNNGVSWSIVNSSFTPYTHDGCSIDSNSFGDIYVVDCNGLFFVSDNFGIRWREIGDVNGGSNTNNPRGIAEYSIFTDLKFQIRNCSLADCSGENFVGPDNTSDTFFTNLNSGFNKQSRFFQYKSFFSTQGSLFSPEIYNTSLEYSMIDEVSPGIYFTSETTAEGEYNMVDQDWVNVAVNTSDSSQVYSFVNFNNSLIGFWKLEDSGSVAIDSSGNSQNGIILGATSAQGKFNNSFYFDGVNDGINVWDSDSFSFGDGTNDEPFSISLFAYPKNFSGINSLVLKDGASGFREYELAFSAGNLVFYLYNLGGNSYIGKYSNSVYSPNQWYHLAAVYNGNKTSSGISLYVNGQKVTDSISQSGTYVSMTNTLSNLTIGHKPSYSWYFNGSIDEVLMFDKALSASEILALYNATSYSRNFTGLSSDNYSFYAYVRDSYGNSNQTETRLINFVDNTAPGVTIIEPSELTYSAGENVSVNYSIFDYEGDLDSCWYNLNLGTNTTIGGCENFSLDLSPGDYNLWIYANDTAGLYGGANVSFSVTNTAPTVNIIEPSQVSYSVVESIPINYSAYDLEDGLDSCWYNLNGGGNVSLGGCENTSISLEVGSYVLTVYANDTSGLVGGTNVIFSVLNSAPTIVISYPQEGMTFGYNESIELNFVFSDADGNNESCWYSLLGDNFSIPNCENTTFDVPSNGNYLIYLYINDSEGEIAFDDVSFSVALGAPTINLIFPVTNYLNYSENIEFNYVPDDVDLETCELWGDFSGTWNFTDRDYSPLNGEVNSFILNLSDGLYQWNIKCNDSQGNSAFNGNKTFYVDTTSPSLVLKEPQGTKDSRIVSLIWNVSDLTLNSCIYNVYRGENLEKINTTVVCTSGQDSFNVTVDADFVLNFYVNDLAGNVNSESLTFSVDTTSSIPSLDTPVQSGNSGGGGAVALTTKLDVGKISAFSVQNVGAKKILSWNVQNTGTRYLNDCEFKSRGEYSSWITYTEEKDLAAGEAYEIVFDVNIPENVQPGYYNFDVSLVCQEINKSTTFQIEVIAKTLNFNFINIERETSESVRVDYSLQEISGKDQDVILEFLLFDSTNKKIAEINETRFVGAGETLEFVNSLNIPEEIEGEMGLLVNINSETYSGFVQENVVLGGPISGFTIFDRLGNADNIISVALVVLFLAFMFFIVRRIKKHNLKTRENVRAMVRENKILPSKVKSQFDKRILEAIERGGRVKGKQAEKEINLAKRIARRK